MSLGKSWHFRITRNSDAFGKGISKIGKLTAETLIWDDIRAFLAVARAGTLSGAASAMAVGIATVSRRIERLEGALAQPLFIRQQSGYRLTEDGLALIGRAEEMEAASLALTAGLRGDRPISGTVRLATAENLATELIAPALGPFRASYPHLTLEIVTDIATVNLHRRDADIALRMVKPDRGNVSLQRLGTLGYGLYGAPAYLAQRGDVAETSRFETDCFIGWAETHANLPAAQWIERILQGRAPSATTTSLATQRALCESGIGLAVLPHFLAAPRGLICVARDLGIDQPIWLVTQSDLAKSRRVEAVAAFLRGLVHTHKAALSG